MTCSVSHGGDPDMNPRPSLPLIPIPPGRSHAMQGRIAARERVWRVLLEIRALAERWLGCSDLSLGDSEMHRSPLPAMDSSAVGRGGGEARLGRGLCLKTPISSPRSSLSSTSSLPDAQHSFRRFWWAALPSLLTCAPIEEVGELGEEQKREGLQVQASDDELCFASRLRIDGSSRSKWMRMGKQGKAEVEIVPAPVFRFKPLQSQGRDVYSVGGDDSSTESDDSEGVPHGNMPVERAMPSKFDKSYGKMSAYEKTPVHEKKPVYEKTPAYEKAPVYEKTPVYAKEKRDCRPPKSSTTKKAKEAREIMEKAREVLQDATARSSSSLSRSFSPPDRSSGDLVDDAAHMQEQPAEWGVRKTMIKKLAAQLRSELEDQCRELVTLQRQWKSELPVTVAVPVTVHPEAVAIVAATKPVRVNVRKSKAKEPKRGRGEPAVQRGPVKLPIRRRIAWRANEREALRRGLLSFGLGRSEKVRDVMSSLLKELRHGIGDIADCCWEFLRCCGIHADAKEVVEYAQKRYANVREMDLESGPELTERVGVFEKTDKSSTLWLRRLKLLDSLQEVIRILTNDEQRQVAYRAIDSVKDASVPADWWSREADLALLYGIFKHGFGNYDLIRNDPEFRHAFTVKAPKARNGEDDDTESEDDSARRIEISEAQWPDAQVLTRRLKRLVDHIIRLNNMPAKPPKGGSVNTRAGEDTPWSKRERLELIKLLMRWGVPLLPGGNGKLNWPFIRDVTSSAPLRRRKDSSLDAGYQELMNDMKDYLEGTDPDKSGAKKKKKNLVKQAGDDNAAKASVLTYKTAVRLKERIEIIDTLRLGVETIHGDWASLGFTQHQNTHDLPRWWIAGEHDHALARGVLKHGVGSWEAIFSDASLGFEADFALQGQGHGRNNHVEASDKEDSDDENTDDENEPKPRPAQKPAGAAQLNIPSPTACIKRLKFVTNVLRRVFKKPKPKRKRATPEVKEVEVMRENSRAQKRPNSEMREVEMTRAPKRPKYVAPPPPPPPRSPTPSPPASPSAESDDSGEMEYDIERDESGYPLLPLQLTEELTLVDLGTVDPDNPRIFQRDPYIYPIGYVAEREYASMVNASDTTTYTCSIIDGGDEGPVFQVTPADVPELYVAKNSAQGVWTVIYAAVNRVAKDPYRDRNPRSGVEMFGLNHPLVVQLIQEQIDAHASYREQQRQQMRVAEHSYRREPVLEAEVPVSSRDRTKGKDKRPQSRSSRKEKEEPPPRRPPPQKIDFDLNSDPDDEDTE
ncbi:hypothetical protein R1flu_002329 [Riccia fluitans]|uniref:Uncharacterized protein n=1 Tax=Riccia fluitans TaxID=41844 RepID=A0ABD1Y5V1_9MARC